MMQSSQNGTRLYPWVNSLADRYVAACLNQRSECLLLSGKHTTLPCGLGNF